MDVGKIALCVIGRLENAYAKEYVSHYRSLGFDKIYIYDNNHEDEEHFDDVLGDEINEGFVEVVNWRDKEKAQREAYKDCYAQHGSEYAWIAFFDFDEFLTIVDGSDIHTFMRKYEGFDCLLLNWMNYTDNGLVKNDGRPVLERFIEPMPFDKCVGKDFPENNHVKSIVRGGLSSLAFARNPHIPSNTSIKSCNAPGKKCSNKPYQKYDHSIAYLKHFTTKTIEEWVNNKMVKGAGDRTKAEFDEAYKDYFFKVNERTPEKEVYLNPKKGRVAAMALGRLGNQMFIAAAAMTFAKRTDREFVGLVKNKGKNYDYDYPTEQFATVMRNVKYIDESEVKDFYKMKQGEYLCNGFPDVKEEDVLLNDYYQDATCIDDDIAYSLFAPYNEILFQIQSLYGDLSEYVCVNVRRGDYLKVQHLGFNVLTKEQIDSIVEEHFPNDKIFFVSDDIEWCKENFKGERYRFADKPGRWKPEMDLYLQTQCKANIISNSTFSWWGAYLNESAVKVVCPMPWFADGKITNMDKIVPKNWEKWEVVNYRIWITYHKDVLIDEYGLQEDAHHKLFAVHKEPQLENVNYMNPCWSEMVTMWYVWKNQLKSKYVGFNHYRRRFNVTELPKRGKCFVYKKMVMNESVREQFGRHHNIKDIDLMAQFLEEKPWGAPFAKYLKESNILLPTCCFLMSWEDFDKMCGFLFPLLEEFSEKVGCGMDVKKWREKAVKDFGEENATYQMRLVGFIAERLISCWIYNSLKWRGA